MIDKLNYGPHGYSTHEESFAVENEYQSNHSGSLQMMPPLHHSKQHMSYSSGTHGSNGWHGHGKTTMQLSNGWHPHQAQGGWSSHNASHGHYNHGPAGGKFPGMHGPAAGRKSNKMMSAEYKTYQAGPGQMRMQNFGMYSESYDDSANGGNGGRQKVEWKAL